MRPSPSERRIGEARERATCRFAEPCGSPAEMAGPATPSATQLDQWPEPTVDPPSTAASIQHPAAPHYCHADHRDLACPGSPAAPKWTLAARYLMRVEAGSVELPAPTAPM